MSYFGSFSNSAFSREEPYRATVASEPYGSSRYALSDQAWIMGQTTNSWPAQQQQQQPQYEQQFQSSFDQPRYMQVFEQQSISRPLNPMGASMQSMLPLSSYAGGSALSGSAFGSGRNDRYDDRRDYGRDRRDSGRDRRDNRQWNSQGDMRSGGHRGGRGGSYRNDNRNGGGNRSHGDNRRSFDRKSDNAPRRLNEGTSPKQGYNKRSDPSRIAPASNSRGDDNRRSSGRGRDGGGDRGGKKNIQSGRPPMKRRNNKSTDLEFKSIPSDVESKTFVIKGDNLVCFNGLQSVLATQHEFPIVIDGNVYASVDHYYQIEKCKQLAGKDCEPLVATVQAEDEYKVKDKKSGSNYGQLARDFIKENKIDRSTVEEWRREGGVFATYTAMRAKAQQCSEMRELLKKALGKLIVHTYAGDAIFGTGTRIQFVHKWADDEAKKGKKIQISLAPLLDAEAISMAPQIAQGRNILGLIHMQLAEEIDKGALPHVITAASFEADAGSLTNPIDISGVEISQEQEDELMGDE